MEKERFNQACRSLRHGQIVRVSLISGGQVEGMPLRHVLADIHDGSLELDTRNGIINLLSSTIANIEPISQTHI